MCLIIDTNVFPLVFDKSNSGHHNFSPVLRWIKNRGKIIYGGTTYKNEIRKMQRYAHLLAEFKKNNKVAIVNDEEVDRLEQRLKRFSSVNFDDPHIVALFAISNCKVIATNDERLIRSFRRIPELSRYRPSFYRKENHHRLLCDDNIIGACR